MFFLKMFVRLLESNVPREVKQLIGGNVAIFTDSCYERDSNDWHCGLGRVCCFNGLVQFFSLAVDAKGRRILGELQKKILFEAETLAPVVAFSRGRARSSTRAASCLLTKAPNFLC